MLVQCTKKLLDELKVMPAERAEDAKSLWSWHANLLKYGREKFIVLVNDQNRFVIVLYGLKAKDKKNMDKLVKRGIREVFESAFIKDEVIEMYLKAASSELVFSKTKDRKLVARMNKSAEFVDVGEDFWNPDSLVQVEMSKWINSLLVGDGKNDYYYPYEKMQHDLEVFSRQPIFDTEAMVLKVKLELENHSVWRRIQVPANITFSELHKVLQTAFSWQNSHLHDFEIFDKKEDSSGWKERPSLNLVCHEEAFAYEMGVPMKMEKGMKVKEFQQKRMVYNYDFGDGWKHIIEVEQVVQDYTVNYAICQDGEGNAPPEGVGGEGGFENFLEIINDPNSPEHAVMKEWGEMQGYEEFDIKEINLRLK